MPRDSARGPGYSDNPPHPVLLRYRDACPMHAARRSTARPASRRSASSVFPIDAATSLIGSSSKYILWIASRYSAGSFAMHMIIAATASCRRITWLAVVKSGMIRSSIA